MKSFDMLEAVLREEFKDFKDNFSQKTDSELLKVVNEKGDVIAPLTIKKDAFEQVEKTFDEVFDLRDEDNAEDAAYLYRAISDKVKIIRNVDADKGLKFILKTLMTRAEDNAFAGILIINRMTGFVFNPLHPFNTFLLINGKVNLPNTFDIFIFDFKIKEDLEYIEEAYKLHLSYFLLFKNSLKENIEYKIEIRDERSNFDEIMFVSDVDAEIQIRKVVSHNFETLGIPLQILSKGELVPYMGWAAITKDIKAIPLWGNGSGNLKSYHYSTDQIVCTGDKSKESLEGWYTLSKINFNSAWFSRYLNQNYRDLFTAGYMLSRDILTGKIDKLINQTQEEAE